MTSTTETETKVETAPAPAKEVVAAEANDNVDAVKDEKADANSTPASPKKTETLKPAVTVHKKDFENDVVYLYQFVRSATIPSLSSCCLKIETFLRMNQIQYEVCIVCVSKLRLPHPTIIPLFYRMSTTSFATNPRKASYLSSN